MQMWQMLDIRGLTPERSSSGLVRLINRPDSVLTPGGIVLVNQTGWAVAEPAQRLDRTAARRRAHGGADGHARVRLIRAASPARPPVVEVQGWVSYTWGRRPEPHCVNDGIVERLRTIDELAGQLDRIPDRRLRAFCIAEVRSTGIAPVQEGGSAWGGPWTGLGGWAARLTRVLRQLWRNQTHAADQRLALMQAAAVLTDRPVPPPGPETLCRATLLRLVADTPDLHRRAVASSVPQSVSSRLCSLVRRVASAVVAGRLEDARVDTHLRSVLLRVRGSSVPVRND